jgi:ribosomal-protein-serine acetyltransferase
MDFSIKIDDELSLKLRHEEDTEAVFNLVEKNRDHLKPWLPWVDGTLTPEDSKKYIVGELENFKNKKTADFGIFYKEKLIGSMGFNKIDLINEKAEIGYWIDSDYEGKGIITKCVTAIINYGFNELNLNRIEIKCSALNKRSAAIPKKLSFTLEATLREDHKIKDPETASEFTDGLIFGLLKKDWINK